MLRDLLLRLVTPTPEGEPVRSRVPRRHGRHRRRTRAAGRAAGRRPAGDQRRRHGRARPRVARPGLAPAAGLARRRRRGPADPAATWRCRRRLGRHGPARQRALPRRPPRAGPRVAGPTPTPTSPRSSERSSTPAPSGSEPRPTTTEQRLRQQTRQNRRLRALLAGAAALLVVAIVAGLLASGRRTGPIAPQSSPTPAGSAPRPWSRTTSTGRCCSRSRASGSTTRRTPGPTSWPRWRGTQGSSPPSPAKEQASSLPSSAPMARSPPLVEHSGFVLLLHSTRELLGTYHKFWAWKAEYRPDGKQLAVSTKETWPHTWSSRRQRCRLVDARTFEDEPVQLGGAPGHLPEAPHYSADGRFLAVPFGTTVMVWDLAARDAPVQRVVASEHGPGVALSPDGSLLYVGTATAPKVTAYGGPDRPCRRVRPTCPAGCCRVSPDGTLLAAAGDRDIVLLEAPTLSERGRLQGHLDVVQNIQFSHRGELSPRAPTTTPPSSGTPPPQRRGAVPGSLRHAVWGVDFSPDDRTLYTAGLDGALLALGPGRRSSVDPPLPSAGPSPTAPTPCTPRQPVKLSPTSARRGPSSSSTSPRAGRPRSRHRPRPVRGRVWRPDGHLFATAGADGFVRVWDWRTAELLAERTVAPGHIAGLDYTVDGNS